jgi:hypothetical protein
MPREVEPSIDGAENWAAPKGPEATKPPTYEEKITPPMTDNIKGPDEYVPDEADYSGLPENTINTIPGFNTEAKQPEEAFPVNNENNEDPGKEKLN